MFGKLFLNYQISDNDVCVISSYSHNDVCVMICRPRVEHPLVQRIVGLGGLGQHRQHPFLGIQRPPGPLAPLTSHADKQDLKNKESKDDDDDDRDDDDEKRRKKKTRTVFSRSQVGIRFEIQRFFSRHFFIGQSFITIEGVSTGINI